MQRIKYISILLTALLALVMASCSTDEATPDTPVTPGNEQVRVRLNIGVEEPVLSGTTRGGTSTRAWNDENAADGEMMKSWAVVAVKSDGTVDDVIESGNLSSELEDDYAWVNLTTDGNGTTHTFYSFANISKNDIAKAMGLSGEAALVKGATIDVANDANWTYNVDGNKSSVTEFTNGIPMSNKQQIAVTGSTNPVQTIQLNVVRMVAKINVTITNNSSDNIDIRYLSFIGLTDYVTSGENAKDNLKLLPGSIRENSTKRNTNLNDTPATVKYTGGSYEGMLFVKDEVLPGTQSGSTEKSKKTYTVYVNESQMSADHYLRMVLYTGKSPKYGAEADEMTYAFRDGTESDNMWRSIARNEIHNLNITIDKYRVQIDVTAFTAIGVVPSCVDDDTLATINLGMYGEFHLTPRIIDRETGAKIDNARLTGTDGEGSYPSITFNSAATEDLDNKIAHFTAANGPFIWWNRISEPPLFGLSIGNVTGQGIYDFSAKIGDQDVSKRIKIINTAIDFSKLAKKNR